MFWKKRDPERDRYYCLPGMGRSNRRHHQATRIWAAVFGVFISLLFGFALYWMNHR